MKKYWWLFPFGIAMGYLEAAVVVYLREIFSITSTYAQIVETRDIALNLGVIAFLKISSALKILSDSKILFIDGFAGPGIYEGGEDGSPLIAIRAYQDHFAKEMLKNS